MENMITIIEGSEFCVDARELYEKLESTRRFDKWIEHRLERSELDKGKDYVAIRSTSVGYWLTLDAAKHICLMERSVKGKQIRQWFIDRDKKLRDIEKHSTHNHIQMSPVQRLELELQIARQSEENAKKIKALEIQNDDIRKLAVQANEYNSGKSGFYTIRGYAKITNLKTSVKEAKEIAYIARNISKKLGLEVQKCNDERFGSVNLYHEDALKKAFDTYLSENEHEEFLF